MNERLMDFLWRSEVARLPEEKRNLYQFIVKEEDLLVEEAVTVEEFRSLIIKKSPVDLAVDHFQLPYTSIVKTLMEVEAELDERISVRCNGVKWIDFTDKAFKNTSNDGSKQLFLFIN